MKIFEYDVIIIGTGAAGYNAACRIKEDGRLSCAIVTEGLTAERRAIPAATSRRTISSVSAATAPTA